MSHITKFLSSKKEISIFKILLIGLVIAGIIGAVYMFQKQSSVNKQVSQVSDVLSKVGELIDLPKDETPTVAIISDAEKLKGEPIFAKAVTGDYVLIYNKAGKIIIYRPFTNKIIETAPLSAIKNLPRESVPTQAQINFDNLTIALYNAGATGSAILDSAEEKLKDTYPKIKIVAKEESAQKTYSKNLVVDVKGSKKDEVDLLKELFNADISVLPEGENPPSADILIIIAE